MTDQTEPKRRLCAHADDDGRGMHWLEPGERCPDDPRAEAAEVEMLTYTLDLIDKAPRSNTYRRQAELLLASDWLAADRAAAEARGAQEFAQAAYDEWPIGSCAHKCFREDEHIAPKDCLHGPDWLRDRAARQAASRVGGDGA